MTFGQDKGSVDSHPGNSQDIEMSHANLHLVMEDTHKICSTHAIGIKTKGIGVSDGTPNIT